MAFTRSAFEPTVFGNKRAVMFTVTADANSGSVSSGLQVIERVYTSVISAATGSQKFKMNLSDAQAASNGTLFMSSCTSGDAFHVLCVGR